MKTGIVVIGRNEGARLKECLASLMDQNCPIVYVDSCSTDASVSIANEFGVIVAELEASSNLCAALARNVGYEKLIEACPEIELVQFIDGDCVLIDGWLTSAIDFLSKNIKYAACVGWLSERNPEMSIYNRLGDLEWHIFPTGEVEQVGGIFIIRKTAFDDAGGFDSSVCAGEEPELCSRLGQLGWRLYKLDVEMATHDLAMHGFKQWARRQIRTGYGGLDIASRFDLKYFRQGVRRARFWSIWSVSLIVATLAVYNIFGLMEAFVTFIIVFLIWPAQMLRIAYRTWRKIGIPPLSLAYGFFSMIAFWPQMIGQIEYMIDRSRKKPAKLVEYKSN